MTRFDFAQKSTVQRTNVRLPQSLLDEVCKSCYAINRQHSSFTQKAFANCSLRLLHWAVNSISEVEGVLRLLEGKRVLADFSISRELFAHDERKDAICRAEIDTKLLESLTSMIQIEGKNANKSQVFREACAIGSVILPHLLGPDRIKAQILNPGMQPLTLDLDRLLSSEETAPPHSHEVTSVDESIHVPSDIYAGGEVLPPKGQISIEDLCSVV